jgi:prolyl oligopeptidase
MTAQASAPTGPPARRVDTVEVLHGHVVADPYRWLEDSDSDETRLWSAAQARRCAAYLDGLPGRDRLRERITALYGTGSTTAPIWRGARRFRTQREPGAERPVLLVADDHEQERVLIDPVLLDPSGTATLDSWVPSPDGRLLAYKFSLAGTEDAALHVLDVATGEVVDGPITRTRYSALAWLPGVDAFYYVRSLTDGSARRVHLHHLGAESDPVVFGADLPDDTDFGLVVSLDGRWLSLGAARATENRSDLWLADLSRSLVAPEIRPVQVGVDADSGLYVWRDGRVCVFTDRDAPRSRLCVTTPDALDYSEWRDLVPEDPEAVLVDFAVLDGPELDRPLLLVGWLRHAAGEISVHDLATGARVGEVPLPGVGSLGGLSERPDGGHEVWFTHTDSTSPGRVLHYDARTGKTTTWAEAPGAVDVPAVRDSWIECRSADGTTVRMLAVEPVGRTGPRPTILFGYGGFGSALAPAYDPAVLAWVEAGGVHVTAIVRGGGEEGEAWHRAGMREHKQNTFDDVHAAAEALIAGGWTTPERLALHGGSNGGLLVGAAMTQRPELYRAAVAESPLLDMVRYERFGLGHLWTAEYGSAEVAEELGWLLGYSPYHHVRPDTDYPAALFTVSDNDTRVHPMHARKMCAALAHAGGFALLRVESTVGHKGRTASSAAALSADVLAFLAHHTGLT